MTRLRIVLGVCVLALAFSPDAVAQTVTGSVVERSTGAMIGGVVVLLVDANDNAVARTLSSESGRYRLAAPGAGTYRVRTLRLGYRPFTTDAFELTAGRELTQNLDVASIPFLLDTVRASGRNACRDRSGTDVASVVWEQVRTSLYAAQIASKLPAINAALQTYERVYEPGTSRIRQQSVVTKSGFTTSAWISLSADSLSRVGYVEESKDGWTTYYSPDVDVLLTRTFQADHCFRLARSKDSTLTGVSFEPTRTRGSIADIKGTIWLDTKTSELRRLEYRYTNVTPLQEDAGAGGQMDFVRIRNGGFATSRWNIRMPVVLIEVGGRPSTRERLAEVRVAGGELLAVTLQDDTLWVRPGIVLVGIITDSTSGARVPLARVALSGTENRTTADSRGRFELRDVLPGEYTLEVRTASLDSMNAVHNTTVTVESDPRPLAIRVAKADELAKSLCAFDRTYARNALRGIILGTSRLLGDSLPPTNVLVAAEWDETEYKVENNQPSNRRVRRWKEVRTDSKGAFRLCGLPTNTAIRVQAAGDSAEAATISVRIAEGRLFERAELVFDHVVARSAVFAGTVLVDSTQQPIPDVEVALPGLKRSMLTNDQGRFRFADVPAGEHQVVARRVGYGPLDAKLTFTPGQTQSRKIFMAKVPILDVVDVTASRLPLEFEENRRLGLGHFMTRAELAKLEHASLPGALATMPSISVTPVLDPFTGKTVTAVGTRRTVKEAGMAPNFGCLSVVYIDKMIVQSGRAGDPLFDLKTLQPDDVEAIQWFASALQVPNEYNSRESKCGVLVIHTRKGP
jgi:hypothetical protein